MAKAIKVKETSFNEAKKAIEQAKITHSWDIHPNAHKTFCLIVRNSEALLDSLENQMHWMDATDPGPAYDNYVNARKQLR